MLSDEFFLTKIFFYKKKWGFVSFTRINRRKMLLWLTKIFTHPLTNLSNQYKCFFLWIFLWIISFCFFSGNNRTTHHDPEFPACGWKLSDKGTRSRKKNICCRRKIVELLSLTSWRCLQSFEDSYVIKNLIMLVGRSITINPDIIPRNIWV